MASQSKELVARALTLGFKQIKFAIDDKALGIVTEILVAQMDFCIDAITKGNLSTGQAVAHVTKMLIPVLGITSSKGECVGGIIAMAIDVGFGAFKCSTGVGCLIVAVQAAGMIQDAINTLKVCNSAFFPAPTQSRSAAISTGHYQQINGLKKFGFDPFSGFANSTPAL